MKANNPISLDEMNNKLPFSVPENYFEEFALKMDKQIAAAKSIRLKKIRRWMYAAAVFAGMMISGGAYYSHYQKQQDAAYVENYESYILSQVDEPSMIDYYLINKQNNPSK